MKKLVAILVALLVLNSLSYSQCTDPNAYCMTSGIFNTCTGTFYDFGGAGAYPDTPITMTICPDNPGDVIQLDFSAFALQTSPNGNNSDYLQDEST